jgi:GH18 family chitinase
MITNRSSSKEFSTKGPNGFRVVAYATEKTVPSLVSYEKLTHINYAFLLPNEDGTFRDLPEHHMLEQLIRLAHQQDVKVLLSVGGWGLDRQFESLAASPVRRATFIQGLLMVVSQYHFDGVDIDWEYPDPGLAAKNFLVLMRELRIALHKDDLLTAALVALGEHAPGILNESFAEMDFANIMAYDDSTGPQHSSMDYAKSALDYWLGRGLPPQKATLGVPFYARPIEVTYGKIVQTDPRAAQLDSTMYEGELVNYNGIPTIQAKTRMAKQRASGIMFWKLENDDLGELSLVRAIHEVVGEEMGRQET